MEASPCMMSINAAPIRLSMCSKSSSIDRVDVTIVTHLVLCRLPLMSVYFLSCDIDERPFLFLDFLEMYRFVRIQPHLPYI